LTIKEAYGEFVLQDVAERGIALIAWSARLRFTDLVARRFRDRQRAIFFVESW